MFFDSARYVAHHEYQVSQLSAGRDLVGGDRGRNRRVRRWGRSAGRALP
ncbi:MULTISPECIES: hypothetical protein [unclassified Frankia]|nr:MULTISPECIES: hypothetical protein [unclassified Frankia]